MLADLMAMSRSMEKRSQDEHVKRSLEEPYPLLYEFRHGRYSTLNLKSMVDFRLSIVNGLANCGFSNDDFRPTGVSSPRLNWKRSGDFAPTDIGLAPRVPV